MRSNWWKAGIVSRSALVLNPRRSAKAHCVARPTLSPSHPETSPMHPKSLEWFIASCYELGLYFKYRKSYLIVLKNSLRVTMTSKDGYLLLQWIQAVSEFRRYTNECSLSCYIIIRRLHESVCLLNSLVWFWLSVHLAIMGNTQSSEAKRPDPISALPNICVFDTCLVSWFVVKIVEAKHFYDVNPTTENWKKNYVVKKKK